MNQLLIHPDEIEENTAIITSKAKITHVKKCLKKYSSGSIIKVGILNSAMGNAKVIKADNSQLILELDCKTLPPEPLPLTLVAALPRPKVFKKIIQYSTALGIKKLFFVRTWKVEKSFFQSPELLDQNINNNLMLGLEQSRDTIIPKVQIYKLFKPFVEDILPSISDGSSKITAHPYAQDFSINDKSSNVTLFLGPEGGFTEYEIQMLEKIGFSTYSFTDRILKIETALSYITAKLF